MTSQYLPVIDKLSVSFMNGTFHGRYDLTNKNMSYACKMIYLYIFMFLEYEGNEQLLVCAITYSSLFSCWLTASQISCVLSFNQLELVLSEWALKESIWIWKGTNWSSENVQQRKYQQTITISTFQNDTKF